MNKSDQMAVISIIAQFFESPIFKDGITSLSIKLINLGAGITLAVLLARALGPEGYGTYSFALAVMTLIAIPTQVGLPTLLMREVAHYQLEQRWSLLKGLLLRASQFTLVFSGAVMVVSGVSVYFLGIGKDHAPETNTFLCALILIPLIALGNLRGAALIGLRRVLQGQLPDMIIRPCLLIVFVAVVWSFGFLNSVSAMVLNGLCSTIAFLIGLYLLRQSMPKEVSLAPPSYDTGTWLHSLWPLSLLAGVQVLNSSTDLVMLGILTDNKDVGIYRVAVQGSFLVSFGLYAVSVVVSPHFSRLFSAGRMAELQQLVTSSTRLVLFTALPVCLTFMLFGHWILAFVFGQAYASGATALAILCTGQLINCMTGCVGKLLNMSGHERYTLIGVSISAVANVLLNAFLIPAYGMEGAAIATATSFAIWNIILWHVARTKLGIDSSPIGCLVVKPEGSL